VSALDDGARRGTSDRHTVRRGRRPTRPLSLCAPPDEPTWA
jgi:hypothetical protein